MECAIFSHTWDTGEVKFQEIADLQLAKTKPGFSKIQKACGLARDRGVQYEWVDTCCIDKSSSAESTEALNSMFRWYKDSTVCFVYLPISRPAKCMITVSIVPSVNAGGSSVDGRFKSL